MPCPRCNAPDIQNAQANYCFYCGYVLNPARRQTESSSARGLNALAVLLGVQLFASIFFLFFPWLMQKAGFTEFFGAPYRLVSGFFSLAEIVLLVLAGIYIRQRHLQPLLIIFACLRFLIAIAWLIRW